MSKNAKLLSDVIVEARCSQCCQGVVANICAQKQSN